MRPESPLTLLSTFPTDCGVLDMASEIENCEFTLAAPAALVTSAPLAEPTTPKQYTAIPGTSGGITASCARMARKSTTLVRAVDVEVKVVPVVEDALVDEAVVEEVVVDESVVVDVWVDVVVPVV